MNKINNTLLSLLLGASINSCAGLPRITPTQIVYSPKVQNNLEYLYDNITGTWPFREFAYCGYGETRGDTTFVNHGELPHILQSTPMSVVYQPCDKDAVINIHSHIPSAYPCSLSKTDVESALKDGRRMWHGVLCGDTLAAWHKDTIDRVIAEAGDTLGIGRQKND